MSALDGALKIAVLTQDDCVASVKIDSPRASVAPFFVGRQPEEVVRLAQSLFSLCPAAQSLAALSAAVAARGLSVDPDVLRLRHFRLLAERFWEMLRASALHWPQAAPPDPAALAALREIMTLGRDFADPSKARAAHALMRDKAESLGLRDFAQGDGFFARQWRDAAQDEPEWRLPALEVDCLTMADDVETAQAMKAQNFALAPELPGRRVETGVMARQKSDERRNSLAGRLKARFADMAATLDAMEALLDGAPAPAGLLATKSPAPGEGFAAVDSARGRLYHGLQLDPGGRVADYRIVAPTEWNFHPDGPFVRLLRGANIGRGVEARRRVERLAFVFDPCIGIAVEIRNASDA